jgi:CheY-like chemotaxis protein
VAKDPRTVTAPALTGVRILVVDDEPDTRELLVVVFRQRGAQVTAVSSAGEAFEAVVTAPPDILVADIGLPDLDGYELIRRVRALGPAHGQIPAVTVTAYARSEDRERALAAGYDMHVAKPVDPLDLCRVVARLVGRGPAAQ